MHVPRSCELFSFLVAACAAFGGEEFAPARGTPVGAPPQSGDPSAAVMHFEGLVFYGLPFVETGCAKCDAVGFGLQLGFAGGMEVDEVIHYQVSIESDPID